MNILTTIFYVILAVLVLLLMVLIHEFGHYIVGRLLNFKITEFAIGFGKAIFSKVNKRVSIVGKDISIDGNNGSKTAAREELGYDSSKSEQMISNQMPTAYV